MINEPQEARPAASTVRSSLILLIGVALTVVGCMGVWRAVDVWRHGIPGTATVIDYHSAQSRSMTVVAQVDVTLPQQPAFRTTVEDTFGDAAWTEGGTVNVVCTPLPGAFQCAIDSVKDRWLLPVLFLVAGLVAIAWMVRRWTT